MALKQDITDDKGVKTRYHVIRSFTYKDGKIVVELYSYVNQTTWDAEKKTKEQNATALKYDQDLDALRADLDEYVGVDTDEAKARAVELTNQINDLTLDPNRPRYSDAVDTHYTTTEIEIEYQEPLTLESLYGAISQDPRFEGAEAI